MSSTKSEVHRNLMRKVATLRKQALDVKFDLNNSEYEPLENIGIGAFGVVCSAIHKKTQDTVAIKKIPKVFEVNAIAKRTYREIKILKHFKHDNIISIREILRAKEGKKSLQDIYVVFDLMESDLHKIIYSNQVLSDEHVRYFLYQILRGLKYIHSANVIHRDLKPSNLLVNEDCQLRIGDFGMSRGISSSPDDPNFFMTQYVATRWYRAPEIMLSLLIYTTALDMWSVGCIFAEMLGRKHLFPGKDYISQMKLIIGVVGSPSDSLLGLCQSDMVKNFFQKLGHKDSIPWTTLFPKASRKAINLLSRMLRLHPDERIKVEETLAHPYLNKYHDPDDEPICLPPFNFDFEKTEMNNEQLRDVIYDEIMEYHTPRTPTFSFNAYIRPAPKSAEPAQSNNSFFPSQTLQDEHDKSNTLPVDDKGEKTEKLQEVPVCNDKNLSVLDTKFDIKVDGDKHYIGSNHSTLQLLSNDVVMLSAKVDEKTEDTAVKSDRVSNSSNTDGEKLNHQENKTISMDTKLLIKAAIMNANLRKRTDSTSENKDTGKPKPVTAAQRQREREEKRMKKKWKSMEKMKKQKDKKCPQKEERISILTNADKQLLERWTSMAAKTTKESVHTENCTPFNLSPDAPGKQHFQEIPFSLPSHSSSAIVQHTISLLPGQPQQETAGHINAKQGQLIEDSNQNQYSGLIHQQNTNPSTSLNYSTIDLEGLKLCGMMNLDGNLFQTNDLPINRPSQNLPGVSLMPNVSDADGLQPRRNSDEHSSQHSSGSGPGSPEQNILSVPDNAYTYGTLADNNAASLRKRSSGELSPTQLTAITNTHDPTNTQAAINLENSFQVSPKQNFVCLPEVTLPETRNNQADPSFSLGSRVNQNIPSISLTFPYTENEPSTSNQSSFPQKDSPPDNISLLTKQLSRSQMEDGGPPALVLTPRGTGGGYGVGMDFDQLMSDAQMSGSIRVEPSPLSSSLLSDWMEVTGNINLDLEALEQELQSPMALCYSDFNLYSS